MLQLLTCPNGHSWEAVAADDAAAVGQAVCPVCGEAVDLLPLFDLAPSPDAITASPQPILPPAPPLRDSAGKPVVAGFEVQEGLGRTPQGVHLFRAKQVLVNRTVLLKVVVAREDSGQTAWGALRGEAAALGRVSHPNIVQILDAGERERQLFYNAVEWIDGPTLAQHSAGQPMPPRQAARLVEVLARAVHAAHKQGVVHRGLRPSCIRLQPQPEGDEKRKPGPVEPPFYLAGETTRWLPKISEFGLARRLVEGDAADADLYEDLPAWISPEQAWGRSREIGPGSDIYALGAILYDLLAGRPPVGGRTPGEALEHARTGEPPLLQRLAPKAPTDLALVCRKAMQRNPRNRYRTALDFAEDLRAFLSCRPVKAWQTGTGGRFALWVRRRPLAAVLLLVCLLSAAGMLATYLLGAAEAARAKADAEKQVLLAQNAQMQTAILQRGLEFAGKEQQRSAYFHHVLLADDESRTGGADRARQLLAECPADLRHWEWHLLDRRLNLFGAAEYLSMLAPGQKIADIAFSPDGHWLAAATGGDGDAKPEVCVWDSTKPETSHLLTGFGGPVRRVAFSPDGKRLATASTTPVGFGGTVGEVKEWDAGQGQVLLTHLLNGAAPVDLAYSSDGKRLMIVDDHGSLHAFVADGPAEIRLGFPSGGDWMTRPFRLALLSPDGGKVAVVAPGGETVQIRDTQRAWMAVPAMQHADQITALAFSPETNLLASASRDGTAKVWDVQLNRLVATLSAGPEVLDVAFTPDGRRLATAGGDGVVRIWDPSTGQEVYKLKPFENVAVTAVRFSPAKDDWRLAAAALGTEVRIFGPPRP